MELDEKRYNILENILQHINGKHISLSEKDTKRNNILLNEVLGPIIEIMCAKDILFKNMFQSKFYGGSFYDRLKVCEPSEYDLDCLLCLPKIVEPTIEITDKPGYVKVNLKQLHALAKANDEAAKYPDLTKLLDGPYLSTVKVLAWFESLIKRTLDSFDNNTIVVKAEEKTYSVVVKARKNGPAANLTLIGEYGGQKFNVDIDLVVCFKFFDNQWPKKGYRKNPSNKNTFFIVPKCPKGFPTYFRLSFPEQERELIKSNSVLKSSIRLMKQIRDRQNHKIASYYIKTVFLWEVEKNEKNLWGKPLSYVFMMMLEKYTSYIKDGTIPFYWNSKNNLIEDLNKDTYSGIANQLKRMKDNVDRNLLTDPFTIAKYLLSPEEVDKLRTEVDLGKKHLKKMSSIECNNDAKDRSIDLLDADSLEIRNRLRSLPVIDCCDGCTVTASCSQMLMKILESCAKTNKTNSKLIEVMEIMVAKVDVLDTKVNYLIRENEELKKKLLIRATTLE